MDNLLKPQICIITGTNDFKQRIMFTWYPCTDENYWQENEEMTTIVSYEIDGKWEIVTRDQCTWGWNVLVRTGAKLMYVTKPNSKL